MLVGISGKKQHGKSTVADRLVQAHGFVSVSFADALRDMLYKLDPIAYVHEGYEVGVKALVDALGWDRAKEEYPEIRRLLQRLGTEAGRNVLGENVWVNVVADKIVDLTVDGYEDIVIPDMRFPNEWNTIVSLDGVTARVYREGVTPGPGADHPSETALDDIDMDWNFHNDGTVKDLQYRVDWFVRHYREVRAAA